MSSLVELNIHDNDNDKVIVREQGSDLYQTLLLKSIDETPDILNRFSPNDAFYLGKLYEAKLQIDERKYIEKLKEDKKQPKLFVIENSDKPKTN